MDNGMSEERKTVLCATRTDLSSLSFPIKTRNNLKSSKVYSISQILPLTGKITYDLFIHMLRWNIK